MEVDEAHALIHPQLRTVFLLERRAGQHERLVGGKRRCNQSAQGGQPGRAVRVAERDSGVHFGNIGGRVVTVGVLKAAAQPLCQ